MDSFSILWLLDDRWTLGLNPFMAEFTILLPFTLNIVFLAITSSYKAVYGCD